MQRLGEALGAADLRGATLYPSLRPCGMVSIWAKIGRIIDSARPEDVHRMYFEDRHLDTLDFVPAAFRDDLALIGVSVVAFHRRKASPRHP
jgi:tRNA(adenine34) deaminase